MLWAQFFQRCLYAILLVNLLKHQAASSRSNDVSGNLKHSRLRVSGIDPSLPFTFVLEKGTNLIYMLRPQQSIRQVVLHNETISHFGFRIDNLTKISTDNLAKFKLLKDYPVQPLISQLSACGGACSDEILRIEVEKCWIIQRKRLLENVRLVGNLINGPILLFQNVCMSISTQYPLTHHAARGYMKAYELNDECIYGSLEEAARRPRKMNFSSNHFWEKVEDVRTMELENGRFAAVFTINRLNAIKPQYYVGYAELSIDPSTRKLNVHSESYFANNAQENMGDLQPGMMAPEKKYGYKNWSPFIYNHSSMFIQRLNPLHVTTIADNQNLTAASWGWIYMKTVSIGGPVKTFWQHGELRGGSPAYLINPREYLTFFHTVTILPHQTRQSYFMGAMTFSAHPPFRALRISAGPIVDSSLYHGEWMKQRFDYVYYPMSYIFALRDASSNHSTRSNSYPKGIDSDCSNPLSQAHQVFLIMSFGWQDRATYLADINLCALCNLLVRISSIPRKQALPRRSNISSPHISR